MARSPVHRPCRCRPKSMAARCPTRLREGDKGVCVPGGGGGMPNRVSQQDPCCNCNKGRNGDRALAEMFFGNKDEGLLQQRPYCKGLRKSFVGFATTSVFQRGFLQQRPHRPYCEELQQRLCCKGACTTCSLLQSNVAIGGYQMVAKLVIQWLARRQIDPGPRFRGVL